MDSTASQNDLCVLRQLVDTKLRWYVEYMGITGRVLGYTWYVRVVNDDPCLRALGEGRGQDLATAVASALEDYYGK